MLSFASTEHSLIDATPILFVFGMAPRYVSISFVEKYYTNYWTAFWNVFGEMQVSMAVLLTVQDLLTSIALAFLLSIFAFVLCMGILTGQQSYYNRFRYLRGSLYANVLRRLGASWLTTTVSLGIFFIVLVGIWGTLVILGMNALGIGLLYMIFRAD